MVTKKNGQAGFSLVELMVVVAIIGVLATIAIPRVNRFIAKSRQSEAQVNLSSLYTFNKNFYVEFQGYTDIFGAMGFRPEGNLRYNVGFSSALAVPPNFTALKPGADPGAIRSTLADCPESNDPTVRCKTLRGATNALPTAISGAAVAANYSTFTAQARAQLLTSVDANEDQWTITENKNLANAQDGTVEE